MSDVPSVDQQAMVIAGTTFTDEELHSYARELVAAIGDVDKKQLRYNDIVTCAKVFYNNPKDGVRELIVSCSKGDPLYVSKRPMADVLLNEYRWMIT